MTGAKIHRSLTDARARRLAQAVIYRKALREATGKAESRSALASLAQTQALLVSLRRDIQRVIATPPDPNTALNAALADLRKDGYFARRNWQCCSGCGWSAIPEAKRETAVFCHAQDESRWREGNPIYLAWSGDGQKIVGALAARGLKVAWDGSPAKRIEVAQ